MGGESCTVLRLRLMRKLVMSRTKLLLTVEVALGRLLNSYLYHMAKEYVHKTLQHEQE